MAPAPDLLHQIISGRLSRKIGNYIEENNGKCIVLSAPSDVKLDDENTVQPDIFVVCDRNKFNKHGCVGASDWIIEILSPCNSNYDLVDKFELYQKPGVREYRIVAPEEKRVPVHEFEKGGTTRIYTFDDDIPAGIYKHETVPLKLHIGDTGFIV